jgi:hypothetical protein
MYSSHTVKTAKTIKEKLSLNDIDQELDSTCEYQVLASYGNTVTFETLI